MSQRINNQVSTGPRSELKAANAIPEEQILDAAYQLLLTIGMQRLTMADIARQAGVSRATLYRRWGGVREVIGALTTREWTAVTLAAMPAADEPVGRAELVDGVVRLVRLIRVHPLLRRIVELDPDFLTPYLLTRRGSNTNHQLEMLEAALRLGIAQGSVRAGDPALLARSVLLTAWSFTLTGPVFTDSPEGSGPELDRLDEELRLLLDRYLTDPTDGAE
ncbi:TetR/AcrR family transcriptional regulator [Kitasatospora viridis]|uniref:TetR family transcriptional regulator n=1 Tax=Kitasatospora viridis TaxID=281105 RepID=A0A561UBR4_9ACTN|nr:TetR/AcrR family transcriptional regulator [Kitasatospora viridis]TWF96807.1 TetR family transcriptional regulator [Kitasatospora viridis]